MSTLEWMVAAILTLQLIRFWKDTDFKRLLFPKVRKWLRLKTGNIAFRIKTWKERR